jgi:hypothetical protein
MIKTPLNIALKQTIALYDRYLTDGQIRNDKYFTIVLYSLSSSERRLFLYKVNPYTHKLADKYALVLKSYVAHGTGSGRGDIPTNFSNIPNSHMSSLGAVITGEEYDGKYGRSLRLHGLDIGVNSNIYSRAIVVHKAAYTTSDYVLANGKCGNSHGCLAVQPDLKEEIVSKIRGGSLINLVY